MAVLISRPEFGIYVGHALGFGFWSLLDTAGQEDAVTFPTEQDARDHIKSWDNPPDMSEFSFPEVDDEGRGSIKFTQLGEIGMSHLWPTLIPVL